VSAVSGVGPRYFAGEIAHDFPVWKKNLYLCGVRKFERAQDEPGGFEGRCHLKFISTV
jgi:hypothetical protein